MWNSWLEVLLKWCLKLLVKSEVYNKTSIISIIKLKNYQQMKGWGCVAFEYWPRNSCLVNCRCSKFCQTWVLRYLQAMLIAQCLIQIKLSFSDELLEIPRTNQKLQYYSLMWWSRAKYLHHHSFYFNNELIFYRFLWYYFAAN